MTLKEFIKQHRKEIDQVAKVDKQNDEDRRLWVLNDEGLYLWAKAEGVKI